jgi:cell division protein FtsQ
MPRFAAINKGSADRRQPRLSRFRLLFKLSLFFVLGVLCFLMWFWYTGFLNQKIDQVGQGLLKFQKQTGLHVRRIRIHGRHHLSQAEVLHALKVKPGAPLSTFDMNQAFQNLQNHPWVRHVSLYRRWPDTIDVTIVERKPLALWQYHKKLTLIDDTGAPISQQVNGFQSYPLVLGYRAPLHIPQLIRALKGAPLFKDQLKNAVWVGERRWDLYLKNGLCIKLPEANYAQALRTLNGLEKRKKICSQAKHIIDLRLPRRMVLS